MKQSACRERRAASIFSLLIALVLASQPTQGFCQAPATPDQDVVQMVHTAFTVADGAPPDIHQIAGGPDGFLWIATSRGLTRFDGVHFDQNPVPGFPLQSVFDVFVDRDNTVWAGLLSGGMVRVRQGQVTVMQGNGFPPGTPFAMNQRKDGTLWEVTSRGVAHFDGTRWIPLSADAGYTPIRPDAAVMSSDDMLWIEDEGHVYTLAAGATRFVESSEAKMWRVLRQIAPDNPWQSTDQDMHGSRDAAGTNWFIVDKGIDRYHWRPDGKPSRIEHVGLAEGLSSEDIRDIQMDGGGNIWVSSARGLDRFRPSRFTRVQIAGERDAPAMGRDPAGGIRVSSHVDALWHVTSSTGVQTLPGANLGAFALSSDGTLWMAGKDGLQFERNGKQGRIPLPAEVAGVSPLNDQSLAAAPDGRVWFTVARYGFYRYRDGQWQRLGGQDDPRPMQMAFDAQGQLWNVFVDRITVEKNNQTKSYTAADGMNVGSALSIDVNTSTVWIGGPKGVQFLDHGRFVTLVSSADDALEGVSGLVATASGELWANTLRGVAKISADDIAQTLKDPRHVNRVQWFDHSDGINGSPQQLRPIPTLVQSTDGRIWASTDDGVFTIDPASFRPDLRKLKPLVTHVTADGQAFNIYAPIVLPKLTHALQIDYTAPDLSAPERIRFRYRLDGIDSDWQEAGNRRSAFYTSLPPGHYTLHLLVANEDGTWGDDTAVICFQIPAAWYQTITFKLACGLALIMLMLLAFYLRERRLSRLREVRRLERERIARDLHDTLMQGTQGLIYHVDSALKQTHETHVRIMLIDAVERAQDALIEARERVNTLRNEGAAPIDLVDLVRTSAQTIVRGHQLRLDVQIEGTPRRVHASAAAELTTICQEALSNAVAHARAASIGIILTFHRRWLTIVVQDDGRGIDDAVLRAGGREGHWGLRNMRERAALFRGRVSIGRAGPTGTVISIRAPGSAVYAD